MNFKIENLEFIPNLESKDRSAEIVCHFSGSKYTVLWIKENREGHYIESVLDRMFNPEINQTILMELTKYGITVLDARKRLLERLENEL